MSNIGAIITASSGKAAEVKGFGGVFTCLLEHEVKATKATFEYTGPKMKPEMWAMVMEFFEFTYATEKSEAQVRLFVHPVHGWAAWAFPQDGGTGMTSRELPMDSPEAITQRRQFDEGQGWLYWGTVHHHCSAGAFASSTDDANERDQEGIHITIGHMDKAMRDIHCRMYIKGHKFEPKMHKFWALDVALLDKADEMAHLFGIYPDLDKAARMVMCQNSDALYAACNPPWATAPDIFLFPPEWKDNYRVRRVVVAPYVGGQQNLGWQRQDEREWCTKCYEWTDHNVNTCPKVKTKKELRREKYKNSKLQNGVVKPGAKVSDAELLLDQLEQQASVMGFEQFDFYTLIESLAAGNNGALCEIIVEVLLSKKMKAESLYAVILQREIMAEMLEKEHNGNAVQQQQVQLNQGGLLPDERTGWEGYGG